MTNNKDLKYTQTFKKEPNIPKTYEQFVLEKQQNQAVTDSYMAELDAYNDVSIQRGYGPCRGSFFVPSFIAPAACPHSKEELF